MSCPERIANTQAKIFQHTLVYCSARLCTPAHDCLLQCALVYSSVRLYTLAMFEERPSEKLCFDIGPIDRASNL